MTVRDEWRWTDDRGIQRLVGTDELRAALSSGRLPPSTLVWREGMSDWTQAANRPELEKAVAVGRAILSRGAAPAGDGDRSTPTGIMQARASGAAAKPGPAKPVELPAPKAGAKRPTAPPLPNRAATRTLLGVPSPLAEHVAAVPSIGGAQSGGVQGRVGVTQIPERGVPPDSNAVIPKAPAVPSVSAASAELSRPQRKLTTREIDNLWGSTPLSEDDPTHPNAGREPLPSFELLPSVAEVNAAVAAKTATPNTGGAAARPAVPPAARTPTADRAIAQAASFPKAVASAPRAVAEKAPDVPAVARPAPRPAAPPAPRSNAQKPPAKPPPLPVRQITTTLVAGPGAITPAQPVAEPAPAAPSAAAVETKSEPIAQAVAVPVETQEAERAAPVLSAEDPLHPPARSPSPSQGANEASTQTVGRGRASLPSASSSLSPHKGEALPLPPAAPKLLPSHPAVEEARAARAQLSEPPPAKWDEEPIGAPGSPVAVPMSSLFASGGVLIGMVIAAFFAGRHSAQPTRLVARPVLQLVPLLSKAALPPPLKPCWVSKQPAMWAPKIDKSIPFDVATTSASALAIGYARDGDEAMGIEVSPATGQVKVRFTQKVSDTIERVTPAGAEFKVTTAAGLGGLGSAIHVPSPSPFLLGVKAGAFSIAGSDGQAATLWPLEGSEAPSALRVQIAGEKGYGLTFRRDGAVWGGFLDSARKAAGGLVKIPGSGGSVGKPSSGWNQQELAVIFADRPKEGERWEIRVGRAPAGQIPKETQVVPLPGGGPGGDAFAPDIAGLPDGRWLMIWTEGSSGSRAVRAQTFAPDLTPLGDPIALSPPAGNFGQGGIGIAGSYAATVFLSKGSSGFELWGSVLQCG